MQMHNASTEVSMTLHDELKKWRAAEARAEARLDQSRSDAEYNGNLDSLRHASRQVEATLYKINGW